MTGAVPSSAVISSQLEREENFEHWRAAVASIFNVQPLDQDFRQNFRADLTAYHAESFLVGFSSTDPQRFHRPNALAGAVGIDHLLFQLYTKGNCRFEAEGKIGEIRAGDLVCFDLSREHSASSDQIDVISMVVPRALVQLPPKALDKAHGVVIDGESAMGWLLGQQMNSLYAAVPRFQSNDVPVAANLASTILTAGLSVATSTKTADEGASVVVTLQMIRSFIEHNLANHELSPELIRRRFAISRAVLYRIFEPLGGIAEYIRDRRLDRAALYISSVEPGRGSVSRLADRCGFANETAFSRAFRQRFGMNPRDMIGYQAGERKGVHLPSRKPGNWLQDWMENLEVSRTL